MIIGNISVFFWKFLVVFNSMYTSLRTTFQAVLKQFDNNDLNQQSLQNLQNRCNLDSINTYRSEHQRILQAHHHAVF